MNLNICIYIHIYIYTSNNCTWGYTGPQCLCSWEWPEETGIPAQRAQAQWWYSWVPPLDLCQCFWSRHRTLHVLQQGMQGRWSPGWRVFQRPQLQRHIQAEQPAQELRPVLCGRYWHKWENLPLWVSEAAWGGKTAAEFLRKHLAGGRGNPRCGWHTTASNDRGGSVFTSIYIYI